MTKMKLTEHLDKEKKPRKEQLAKQVLYNFEWQALRTSLDFSEAGVEKSLQLVKDYVEGKAKDSNRINRVWRALNLMAATRMGFSGLLSMNSTGELVSRDQMIKDFRESLSLHYQGLKNIGAYLQVDSAEKQKLDMMNASIKDFARVYASLAFRYENSSQSAARPELRKYLTLMQEAYSAYCQEDRDFIKRELDQKFKGLRKSRRDKVLDWGSLV